MGNIFKSLKSPPKQAQSSISEKDRAILDLKIVRDKLFKYQKRLGTESERLQNQAKELLASGKKDRALLALKLRKHKIKEADSIDAKLLNVMSMIEEIEWESHNIEALRALKAGTDALKKLHEEMSVEDVERLMEETREAREIENEISTLVAGEFTLADESELEAELEMIMARENAESERERTPEQNSQNTDISMPEVPTTPVLPAAPAHDVPVDTVVSSEHKDNSMVAS
mmetsp:Transcript_12438/g.18818  ORF Transcript_12438/g.18818 Transcript_12438/m.18818 type:complete len:230 (+) Transcript_12438:67-756(+)